MKTEKELHELLKDIIPIPEGTDSFKTDLANHENIIREVLFEILEYGKEMYNQALEDAVKTVKLKDKGTFVASTGYSQYKTRKIIDKNSILKLKKK